MHFKLGNQSFDCTIHKNNNIFLLEFELAVDAKKKIVDINQQAKNIIDYMQKPGSLQMLCTFVAEETRIITGYDRVMIYKFDEDYNGHVYAKSKSDGMKSWMNLHYLHTDIPVQARALYLKNTLKIIPDVNYTPSPVFTIDDAPDKDLDLSMSVRRSSSPIHLQYLKNMGVTASLTISPVHSDKLWGMIACHHNTPKYLNGEVRMAATIQGRILTSQISNRDLAEEYGEAKHIDNALNNLLVQVFSSEGLLVDDLVIQKDLLLITKASGVIIILNDKIFSVSNVSEPAEIKKLVNWLHTYSRATGINISNLSSLYKDAKKWSNIVSGVIYHSLGSGQRNCIIWCRPEVIQEVNWAGNPHEAIVKDKGSLSPRNSFETWKET